MLIGLYLLGAGPRAPHMAMFIIVTVLVGTVLTVVMFTAVLPEFMPAYSVWIVGAVCYGIAGGLGIGAMRWPTLGVSLCGTILGYGLGKGIF